MVNENYIPTEEESEIFLSDEPLHLLEQHIRSQFLSPLDLSIDYFANFIDTFTYSRAKMVDEDDVLTLDALKDDMISFMTSLFDKRLGVVFPNLEILDEDDILNTLHMTYRYFIINIRHNFSNYCLNSILNDKDKYMDMELPDNLTVKNMEEAGISELDMKILVNLHNIIYNIIHTENEPDILEFIRKSDWQEPRLETDLVYEWVSNDDITGNFYPQYSSIINDIIIKDIEIAVREKILSLYSGKNPISITENSEDTEDNSNEN